MHAGRGGGVRAGGQGCLAALPGAPVPSAVTLLYFKAKSDQSALMSKSGVFVRSIPKKIKAEYAALIGLKVKNGHLVQSCPLFMRP